MARFSTYAVAAVGAVVTGFVVASALALGWQAAFGGAWQDVFSRTALIVGTLMFISSGNVLSRLTTLESSKWGVSVDRHAREDVTPTLALGALQHLTPFGFGLFAGGPLIVVGLWLLG